MSRCRACDCIIGNPRKIVVNDENGVVVEEDLCSRCRSHSFDEYNYLEDKQYVLQDYTDKDHLLNPTGLTMPSKLND